jgi:acyl-CoA synthetase (AMP-forming)/AMP-acid ligase II
VSQLDVSPGWTSRGDQARSYQGVGWRAAADDSRTVLDALRETSDSREPFLTSWASDGRARTLSYADADRLTRRYATWLRTAHDVGHGSVVGLLMINDEPSVLALLATLRAGATAHVLNPGDPAARIEQQTQASGVGLLLRSADAEDTTTRAVPLPEESELEGLAPLPDALVDAGADALLFGTSGSTAASKIVRQSHLALMTNAEAVRQHHALEPGQRLLSCLPLHHVNGVHFTLLGSLVARAHAVLPRRFDPLGYAALIRDVRPRLASVVPSILEALLVTTREPLSSFGLEYFVSAAAPLPAVTARRVLAGLEVPVLQGYGLTETTNFSTTVPRGLSPRTYASVMLEVEIPPVGVAMPGNDVAVLGPGGRELPPGDVGEVCMRGHNVMSGYLRNPDGDAEALRGGWFHSGDLGYWRVENACRQPLLVLTGRLKNIAKVGGESVSLEEVERAMRALPGVNDAACVIVPDAMLGERIIGAVQFQAEPFDVRAALRSALPATAVPARIFAVPVVPRTATGKVLRPELARHLAGAP